MEKVILVDEQDQQIGLMEKMEAHKKGLLHRAFSVFIFDDEGRMLIHQRADIKYHSGGLWTNACCSHPRDGETVLHAAQRRIDEELGIACDLEARFHFIYRAELDQGLTEHELDHVLIGVHNGPLSPDPEEVKDTRYLSFSELEEEMAAHPERFTEWFKIALPHVLTSLEKSPVKLS